MRIADIGGEIRLVFAAAAAHVWRRRVAYGVTWLSALFVSLILYPYDARMLAWVQRTGAGHESLAITLSQIGRFENSSLLFAIVLASLGMLAGSGQLKRAAAACLLAGLVAGLAATVLRPALGRARPHAQAAPGFHFFEPSAALQSMPSGHTTSNTASAVAIAVVSPPLAVPALLYAAGVGWSRLELNQHYPTDVLWGAILGGSIGLAIGMALREDR